MREQARNPNRSRVVSLHVKARSYLQTLSGALMGPSTDEDGGSAGGRHKAWWASIKSGAGAAIFGKGWDPNVGRCVVGAGGNVGAESGGREVIPAWLLRGAPGGGCLWSSLPKLWNTSSGVPRHKIYCIRTRHTSENLQKKINKIMASLVFSGGWVGYYLIGQ